MVLGCTLAGLLFVEPAGAASRGFNIYNLSSHPLRVLGVQPYSEGGRDYAYAFEGRPDDGAVLMPGAAPHDWEVQYAFTYPNAVRVNYQVVGTGAILSTILYVGPFHNESSCTVNIGACSAQGLTLTVTDPKGTVIDVPASRAQEQATTLRQLCTTTNTAKCDFSPVRREETYAPTVVAGKVVSNCNEEDDAETTIEAKDTVEVSNSVGVSADAKFETNFIFEKAEFSVETKYEREWSTTHTFIQDVLIKIRPRHVGWVTGSAPVLRDTGDFVLTLGDTTWNLRGVYFDTPDPTRPGGFTAKDRPMTAQEVAACQEGSSKLLTRRASAVRLGRSGTAGDDLMDGEAESNTLRGRGGHDRLRGGAGHDALHGGDGNDVLHGGAGRDALYGGAGDDAVHGGSGRDVLRGGAGADTITDRSGATRVRTGTATGPGSDFVNVRDGRGDDTVRCGSARSVVIADPGDRVAAGCGSRGPAAAPSR